VSSTGARPRTLRTGERGGDVSAQLEEAKSSGVGGFYAEA